jgi:hypothetical protein
MIDNVVTILRGAREKLDNGVWHGDTDPAEEYESPLFPKSCLWLATLGDITTHPADVRALIEKYLCQAIGIEVVTEGDRRDILGLIYRWNDTHTDAECKAAMDRAIELAALDAITEWGQENQPDTT